MTNQKEPKKEYRIGESVSIVSHQLKTPLSVIKGYLEVLISGDLGELNKEQKEYLTNVFENTERMMELVKDILNVARIEADRVELNPQPTDLVPILKEIVENFSLFARAHNCELSYKILDNLPPVSVDPIKVKEVMTNFISNAIVYNKKEGRGKVEASLFKKKSEIVFCCKDTGMGIADDEKDKIFTKFYRSEEAVGMTTGGSGLGLFITKAIIEKSGGKVWFESKKGEGSTFCFSLPV